ncbi:MAG: hypothetical protein ACJ8GJ_14400 [Vitreoscilla sp.]
MTPTASEPRSTRTLDDERRQRFATDAGSQADPPAIVAQRLIAVPWRHAGLIAVCALAGGLASTQFWPHPTPVQLAGVQPRVQAIQDAPAASAASLHLRLDLGAGTAASRPAAVQAQTHLADAAPTSSLRLRLDHLSRYDDIEALLRQAAPAAGRVVRAMSDRTAAARGERPGTTLPGLVAGLLLGLLLAGLRELRGERMRSPREAEWALGAPVLGAIPTLSAKAREALLERPPAAPDAA